MAPRLEQWRELTNRKVRVRIAVNTSLGLTKRDAVGVVEIASHSRLCLKTFRFLNISPYYVYSANSGAGHVAQNTGLGSTGPGAGELGFGGRSTPAKGGTRACIVYWPSVSLEAIEGVDLTNTFGPDIKQWSYIALYTYFYRRLNDMVRGDKQMDKYLDNKLTRGSKRRLLEAIRVCRDAQVKHSKDKHSPIIKELFTF